MTSRQDREIAYHKLHAEKLRTELKPISYDVLHSGKRRWWNAYWSLYDILLRKDLRNLTALVVGCGDGIDAVYVAKLGARVHAFDLSPDMISLAQSRALLEGAHLDLCIMGAEQLSYPENTFDIILVRDILHHCEVEKALFELIRVSKDGGFIAINELYTHSILQTWRESRLGKYLHRKLVPVIYGHQEPYITEDEKKLSEPQLQLLERALTDHRCMYFNFIVHRFVPDWPFVAKVDRVLLRLLGHLGYIFAGRFLLAGYLTKQ